MAYTKIHAIKATVDKSINYICNPEKTDDKIFISSYACAPETAAIDFKYTLDHCRENTPNKAYHLIQAFAPGEVSFEEAHKIGKELASRVLEGKYSYVLATHTDKNHVHNHIIFCAANNINFDKYHDCKQTYYRIRNLSDELCKEHNLSVIVPSGKRGRKYNEWQAEKNGTSWKTQIRKDINHAIQSASDYDEFLLLLKAKGYELKGETFEENSGKYISFRPLDKERFVRGSVKSLGKEYTKERIRERIENKGNPKEILQKNDTSTRQMIDTSSEKFQSNIALKRWATVTNLKIAAQSYLEAGTITELEQKLTIKTEATTSAKQCLIQVEKRMNTLGEIIKYAEQYKNNYSYYASYKKAKRPDAYFRKHESEILLFGGAKRMLEQSSVDLKSFNLKKLKAEYQELETKKKELSVTYKTFQKESNQICKQLEQLQEYIGQKQFSSTQKRNEPNHSL